MPRDEIRRQALVRDLTRRCQLAGLDELRVIDRALLELERVREGAGDRRWERRLPTGPGDVDRSFHLVTGRPSLGVVETLCNGSWGFTDLAEHQDNPPLEERCGACWRHAVATDWFAVALIDLADEIAAEDIRKAELHEQARAEMRERDDVRSDHFAHCTYEEENGFCKRDGFGIESHCLLCYKQARARPLPRGPVPPEVIAERDRILAGPVDRIDLCRTIRVVVDDAEMHGGEDG